MKAWIVAVDMGYGHQRAAYPLRDIAYEKIINANSEKLISKKDKRKWRLFRTLYEGLSRFRSVPLIGEFIWRMYDRMQRVTPFYPLKDMSRPTINSRFLDMFIKRGFIKSIVEHTKIKDIPFVTTFFAPAISASYWGLKEVYCIVTDTDINRIWVPKDPKQRIYYLTPTRHAAKRLISYGVPENRVFYTGFPLPKENLGKNLSIAKKDLGERLVNLDPKKNYTQLYEKTLRSKLGKNFVKKSRHPLTLMYAVGGAGAQGYIGVQVIKSLRDDIRKHRIRLILVAGLHTDVEQYYKNIIRNEGLTKEDGKYVKVIFSMNKGELFGEFNRLLRETDILWTKPSELCFYAALGLPIIIAPPLGSHEMMNKDWLIRMGSGIAQENPSYTHQWLFEWLDKGSFAEAAWEGFTEAPKFGTYNIEKLIFDRKARLKF